MVSSALSSAAAAIRQPALSRVSIVLVEPSHPGNIGSAARAMKTMGLSCLILVAPRVADVCRDPQAWALASGATDVLVQARMVTTLAEALADTTLAVAFTARRRELTHRHVALREAAAECVGHLASAAHAAVALVFGNEAMCLSNDDVDRCQLLASVPANPTYPSLNLAQTVQVAAYELMMAAGDYRIAPEAPREAATTGEVDGLVEHLQRAALASGFLDPSQPKRFMTRMRRLAARARLEREEVAVLRGLLASFEKKP